MYNVDTALETEVTLTSANTSHIKFNVPNMEAGEYKVRGRCDIGDTDSPDNFKLKLSGISRTPGQMSTNGGRLTISGTGLPAAWPNTLFLGELTSSNGLGQTLDIVSMSTTEWVINIPAGVDGQTFTFKITDHHGNERSTTTTLMTSATESLTLTSAASAAPGTLSVSLDRSAGIASETPIMLYAYLSNMPEVME